ncbi:MAG: hypothetical protein KA366_02250 [Hydromonas sp.]|nr:hypothetical protein [Hydromonas sp.]MBP6294532.1 hypothetical protein [Hydromonas sp.]
MDKFWWLTLGLLIGWVIHWILTAFFCKCKCTCECCKDGTRSDSNKGSCCSKNQVTEKQSSHFVDGTTHNNLVGSTAKAVAVSPSGLFQIDGQDDLKVIEGIGPKVAEILHAAGIHQFHELAVTPVAKLDEILDAAGLQMMNPGTWPEQAALIAKGDQAGFERLTEELKGGVRV